MFDRKKLIEGFLNKPEIVPAKELSAALVKNGVVLDDMQPIEYLYI
jgi:hypothetical protein